VNRARRLRACVQGVPSAARLVLLSLVASGEIKASTELGRAIHADLV